MGNLHAGHLRLVEQARSCMDRVVVSIFVNPMQFGPAEDFACYPRTPEQDAVLLEAAGADLLFLPPGEVMYPGGAGASTRVEVPALSDILCGVSRPVFFRGVATVVLKLLNMVQPEVAFFGRKDLQQLRVVEQMVRDLQVPVRIEGVATVREADGLAMSSRNGYLTATERGKAAGLYQVLGETRDRIVAGAGDFRMLESAGMEGLRSRGFEPEYLSVCRNRDLAPAAAGDKALAVLAAARLGGTRLIDNLEFSL